MGFCKFSTICFVWQILVFEYRRKNLKIKIDSMHKNTQQIRNKLKNLDSRIGAIVTLTPEMYILLKSMYSNEYIYVRNVEILAENKFKIKYVFPVDDLTNQIINKVSLIQVQLWIVQWIYLSLCLYMKNNPDCIISSEIMENIKERFYYFKDERVFTKNIIPSQESYLLFQIDDIMDKDQFFSLNIHLKQDQESFIYWKIEGIISK